MSIPACIPIKPRPAPSSSSPTATAAAQAGIPVHSQAEIGRRNGYHMHEQALSRSYNPYTSSFNLLSASSSQPFVRSGFHQTPRYPSSPQLGGISERRSSGDLWPHYNGGLGQRKPDSQYSNNRHTMSKSSPDTIRASQGSSVTEYHPIAPRPTGNSSSSLAQSVPVDPEVAPDLATTIAATGGRGDDDSKWKKGQRTIPPPIEGMDIDLHLSRNPRTAANNARDALQKVAQFDGSSSDGSSDLSEPDYEDSDDGKNVKKEVKRGRGSTGTSNGTSATSQRQSSGSAPPSKKPKISDSGQPQSQRRSANDGPAAGRKRLSKATPLDLSTVRTSAPAIMPPRSTERLFGLEHCPIFYPTVDEFAEPLEYIEGIAQQARQHNHGICKVVPPEGWQPPFSLDTETFRFGTRVQQLNSLEASARAQLNFIEQLTIFHRQQEHSRFQIPKLGGKPVDLWQLRKEVNISGGFDIVCSNRRWSQVARAMGYDVEKDHGTTAVLRNAYTKIIQPFEDYRFRIKSATTADGQSVLSSPGQSSSIGGMRSTATGSAAGNGKASLSTAAAVVTAQQVQAASAKLNDALTAGPAGSASSSRNNTPLSVQIPSTNSRAASADEPALSPGEFCELCRSEEDEESILLCDECDKGYHMRCLDPPLTSVPKGDWICDACIVNKGDDFGFEEGEEHNLSTFHTDATAFRQQWLSKHPVPTIDILKSEDTIDGEVDWERELLVEDHVEREFWRLIESPKETVEVEYGADIHTTIWGSAVPTIESHPENPYAKDGWNLNNLPILPGSVLRYVKSDICGMTVPWAYVGMMFSTFAWHKEDHNTYSVNYHHIGGTKTWYGVPGEDDEKLEAAIKAAAPDLFEQQPDLMYQLVTLMSPGKLRAAGVRVSACDQRPNEFVITFPKAYHAGFNHDFNYNEAVNFCLQDWLPYDLEGVKKYKSINKTPVFSHDELLVTIYSYETSQQTSTWLLPLFEEMVNRELERRKKARSITPGLIEVQEDVAFEEDDQYQCLVDKSFCYLSQITTEGRPEVACVDHIDHLHDGKTVMKIRHTDYELRAMLGKVRQRAEWSEPQRASSSKPALAVHRNQTAHRAGEDLPIRPAPPALAPKGPSSVMSSYGNQVWSRYRPQYLGSRPI